MEVDSDADSEVDIRRLIVALFDCVDTLRMGLFALVEAMNVVVGIGDELR